MIGTQKLHQVRSMLGRVPKAVIARKVGVSRRTVHDIARGVERRRAKTQPMIQRKPSKRIGRCPMCGHLVNMPCLSCGLQADQRRA